MTNLDLIRQKDGKFKKRHPSAYLAMGKDHSRFKHGAYGTPIYKKWMGMKRRCLNPHDKSYPRYGGAGVTVSASWMDFQNFSRDMASTFKAGLTIERKDNSKGYSKENCRWATKLEQARNKKSVRLFLWRGRQLSIPELAASLKVKPDTLYRHLREVNFLLDVYFMRHPKQSPETLAFLADILKVE